MRLLHNLFSFRICSSLSRSDRRRRPRRQCLEVLGLEDRKLLSRTIEIGVASARLDHGAIVDSRGLDDGQNGRNQQGSDRSQSPATNVGHDAGDDFGVDGTDKSSSSNGDQDRGTGKERQRGEGGGDRAHNTLLTLKPIRKVAHKPAPKVEHKPGHGELESVHRGGDDRAVAVHASQVVQ
jgi:hypothetical protein